jgi:hypothetical protein
MVENWDLAIEQKGAEGAKKREGKRVTNDELLNDE